MPNLPVFQRVAAVAGLALLSTGCLVNVSHCTDPAPYFAEAMKSAAAVAGRQGPANQIHVLVYDNDDHKLVRVTLPLDWVTRFVDSDLDLDLDLDREFRNICDSDHDSCREARRKLRKFHARDLKKLPLGPIVEVNGDDDERVFVYLR